MGESDEVKKDIEAIKRAIAGDPSFGVIGIVSRLEKLSDKISALNDNVRSQSKEIEKYKYIAVGALIGSGAIGGGIIKLIFF